MQNLKAKPTYNMLKQPKIIIIGAGISGISAARKLIQNGYLNTTILEAENRIGGRINTQQFGGKTIELGAQWCHGEDKNILFEMVKDLNLLSGSKNTYSDLTFYTSKGEILNKNLTDRLLEIFYEISFNDEELKKEDGSFGEYFLKSYRRYLKDFDEDDVKIAEKMTGWFNGMTLCYDGGKNWFEISARGLTEYEICGGNPLLYWKYGFKTIFDLLELNDENKEIPIYDKIEFNKKVVKINWSGERNQIICNDESIYFCDHCIVTIPLGVLKQNYKDLFVPKLPLNKEIAIENLGFGVVNKIFLKFPTQWWGDSPGFSFIWDDEKSWTKSIFGFYIIDSDPLSLMGWSVGDYSHENLSEKEIIDGCMYVLNKFLGRLFIIPQPIEVTWSKWGTSRNFKGSYSFRSVETNENNTSAYELSLPISNKVLFAGEATHSNFYSTVHGALESGYREAERIINFYKQEEIIKTKIAIIGGGMAGLGSAKTFLQSGFDDFLILEASDKIGGRIETLDINGSYLELGAQWLHDSNNYLYKLAKENDLISSELSEEGLGIYIRDDGYIFDDFFVKKVDFIVGEILTDCEKFVDSKIYPKSVGDFLFERFEKFTNKLNNNEKELAWDLFNWHVRFQIIDNSCLNLYEVSAKDWGKYSCLGVNSQKHLNIKNGYKSLINLILQKIPEDKIKLSHPIIEINYKNNVILKDQFNRTIICEKAILTSSIGFLKQNLIKFDPPLPEKQEKTIGAIGFYGMGKIFLIFKERWWNEDGFQLIWRGAGEKSWLKSISGFDSMPLENTLLGWIGGEGILEMEKMDEEIVGRECVDMLRRFLKRDIPYPDKTIRTTWTINPWIKGGYSHTTPLCDRLHVGPTTLSPLEINGSPKVYFSGEAAHESHFSTTHGAFQSGEMTAEKILEDFRKHKL